MGIGQDSSHGGLPVSLAAISGPLIGLVPAYCPASELLPLASQLLKSGLFKKLVIVNDGSPGSFAPIFTQLEEMGCIVLSHARNMGKGEALKTGFRYIEAEFPDCAGVITFDADGQHLARDICSVAETFRTRPHALVLGSRAFEGDIPFRSAFGNALTAKIMAIFCGISLADTQTGLRAIPASLLKPACSLPGKRYEFELDLLLLGKRSGVPFVEKPIKTVYEPGNVSSHFNPVLDSIRIYLVFLRFGAVSIISAFLDYLIFALAIWAGFSILASLVICRSISATFNFIANRNYVFRSGANYARSALLYGLLACLSLGLSWLAIEGLVKLALNPLLAKLIAETVLFMLNFVIQRELIFRQNGKMGI